MANSAHFFLKKILANERLSDDSYAFTTSNIDLIDSLLWSLFNHQHDGVEPEETTPDSPLAVSVSNTGGTIPAGKTVRYKYTLVDASGVETAPSPEVSVSTPPAITAPLAPTLATSSTGGTLLAGTYAYVLTAWTETNSNETTQGAAALVTVPIGTSTNTITITLPSLPAGADGFNVYRRAPGEAVYSFLTEIDMGSATPPSTYLDDGSVEENCNRFPATTNQTNSTNSIEITLPGATPAVPNGYVGWKIYRTYVNGDYSSSYLTQVVEETSEGSGVIVPTYTDTGSATSSSAPPSQSFSLPGFGKIDLNEHTTGDIPPARLIVPHVEMIQYPGPLADGASDFIWVNPFDKAQIMDVQCWFTPDDYEVASQAVIVDIERPVGATPVWTSIYANTARRARVLVGDSIGDPYETTSADNRYLDRGEYFRLAVDQNDTGSSDENLTIAIRMFVQATDPDTFEFDE